MTQEEAAGAVHMEFLVHIGLLQAAHRQHYMFTAIVVLHLRWKHKQGRVDHHAALQHHHHLVQLDDIQLQQAKPGRQAVLHRLLTARDEPQPLAQ
ncbi:hypothetical protein E2C01_045412 [Portunus trituberculatus]|uniref:Uncharacterized protein n=1 Tax=Portunus trituberculatus TaxID=210409 RepID=A0A5B7G2T2_PORTR|nr:hypothetical protein [Portunus trituberculatus]